MSSATQYIFVTALGYCRLLSLVGGAGPHRGRRPGPRCTWRTSPRSYVLTLGHWIDNVRAAASASRRCSPGFSRVLQTYMTVAKLSFARRTAPGVHDPGHQGPPRCTWRAGDPGEPPVSATHGRGPAAGPGRGASRDAVGPVRFRRPRAGRAGRGRSTGSEARAAARGAARRPGRAAGGPTCCCSCPRCAPPSSALFGVWTLGAVPHPVGRALPAVDLDAFVDAAPEHGAHARRRRRSCCRVLVAAWRRRARRGGPVLVADASAWRKAEARR